MLCYWSIPHLLQSGKISFFILIADEQPSEKFSPKVHSYARKRLLKGKQSSFENLLFKADAMEEGRREYVS